MSESVRVERLLGWGGLEPNRPSLAQVPGVSSDDELTMKEYIAAGICPWCGKGPYLVLAGHTSRVHDVDRFKLRDLAGVTYATSICDPTHAAACRQRAVDNDRVSSLTGTKAGPRRNRSQKWYASQREKLREARRRAGGTAAQAAMGRAARDAAAAARRAANPLVCVWCGVAFDARRQGASTRVTCSEACRVATSAQKRSGPPPIFKCKGCGEPFEGSWKSGRRTCSDACLDAARKAAKPALRRERFCVECGAQLPTGIYRKTCSEECRFTRSSRSASETRSRFDIVRENGRIVGVRAKASA